MGHTLVAVFGDDLTASLAMALRGHSVNKIPFGRTEKREAADRVLPYHTTLMHWAKEDDGLYLRRTKQITVRPFSFVAERPAVWRASDSEYLCVLELSLGSGAGAMQRELLRLYKKAMGRTMHITVSVSRDENDVQQVRHLLRRSLTFPHVLPVTALELYHIWEPVRLVRRFLPEGGTP